ncbi:hypothetical protein GWI33_019338 [Rhynchophorus ferrugineus]|uniref:Uncharacterized protein n=1 Tax=Rhynchophorus ferrugineus TaxID=354439 RepID=A0A834M0K3_RHYFE|nr:hypothetical protein GWI33_019338 [Rhynchophorus ferrugineus]
MSIADAERSGLPKEVPESNVSGGLAPANLWKPYAIPETDSGRARPAATTELGRVTWPGLLFRMPIGDCLCNRDP